MADATAAQSAAATLATTSRRTRLRSKTPRFRFVGEPLRRTPKTARCVRLKAVREAGVRSPLRSEILLPLVKGPEQASGTKLQMRKQLDK